MVTIIVFTALVYFIAIVLHEVAHGVAAYALGDPTAKDAGRLTLNPIPHIDLFGTILLPAFAILLQSPVLFGWAKPVPFNPMYFKNVRVGTLIVASAGVATNLALALIFGLAVRFSETALPLATVEIFRLIVLANLVLGIFNLFPIPPLDGSKILFSLLPDGFESIQMFLERYGFFILLLILFFPGGRTIIGSLVYAVFSLIVGV